MQRYREDLRTARIVTEVLDLSYQRMRAQEYVALHDPAPWAVDDAGLPVGCLHPKAIAFSSSGVILKYVYAFSTNYASRYGLSPDVAVKELEEAAHELLLDAVTLTVRPGSYATVSDFHNAYALRDRPTFLLVWKNACKLADQLVLQLERDHLATTSAGAANMLTCPGVTAHEARVAVSGPFLTLEETLRFASSVSRCEVTPDEYREMCELYQRSHNFWGKFELYLERRK